MLFSAYQSSSQSILAKKERARRLATHKKRLGQIKHGKAVGSPLAPADPQRLHTALRLTEREAGIVSSRQGLTVDDEKTEHALKEKRLVNDENNQRLINQMPGRVPFDLARKVRSKTLHRGIMIPVFNPHGHSDTEKENEDNVDLFQNTLPNLNDSQRAVVVELSSTTACILGIDDPLFS